MFLPVGREQSNWRRAMKDFVKREFGTTFEGVGPMGGSRGSEIIQKLGSIKEKRFRLNGEDYFVQNENGSFPYLRGYDGPYQGGPGLGG